MMLWAVATGIFSEVLLLSLVFALVNLVAIMEVSTEDDAPGSSGNLRIRRIQETPSSTSSVSQQRGSPGARITVRAGGFRPFTQVESIEIGGIDVLSDGAITTDENGNFEATDLLVPGLDPGIYSLVIRVGAGDSETAAVSAFEVTPEVTSQSEASGPGTATSPALAPLSDRLERAFHFDNAAKSWTFYDPRPGFVPHNTLVELVPGQVYWIKVTQDATAVLNGRERVLTCASEGTPRESCWNLVVW